MNYKDKNYWAVILGGSSGFGLATAKKLSSAGMNICIIHRDRKSNMAAIEKEFETIRASGVSFVTFNDDALHAETSSRIMNELTAALAGGKVRLLLHSIAFGNLKLIVEQKKKPQTGAAELAAKLNVPAATIQSAVDALFRDGHDEFAAIAEGAQYSNEMFLGDEDMANTIYAMGTSLLTWVQGLHKRQLFANDARVIGLTSEGNEVAWRSYAAVSAAKVALEAVSRSIALEFAPYGLRSNIVQPGVTETPALRLIPGSRQLSAQARRRNPFGRQTDPKDVANLIYLLCSDEAAWINGTIIRCDGGERIAG